MITKERLREVIRYNQKTGLFFWRVAKASTVPAGSRAGTIRNDGYFGIKIDGKTYLGHRLAWLYVYGSFPKGHLDHKNRIKTDCRISNLREATREQNLANQKARQSRSGLRGAYWFPRTGKWEAKISRDGKQRYIGYFNTAEEAHAAWCVAAKELHGEFFYSGRPPR